MGKPSMLGAGLMLAACSQGVGGGSLSSLGSEAGPHALEASVSEDAGESGSSTSDEQTEATTDVSPTIDDTSPDPATDSSATMESAADTEQDEGEHEDEHEDEHESEGDADSGSASEDEDGDTQGCEADEIDCDGDCVDPLTDTSHCGACNVRCTSDQFCAAGVCRLDCEPHEIICEDAGEDICVDPDGDPLFCGASDDCGPGNAGVRCPLGSSCESGECVCSGRLVLCDGRCVDPHTDPMHCGASGDCSPDLAGEQCDADRSCEAGVCRCQAPLLECDTTCIDPITDPVFCGATGQCGPGEMGEQCPLGARCEAGQCQCEAELVECDGRCINPQKHPDFCGADAACMNAAVCDRDVERCVDGACVVICDGKLDVTYRDFRSSHPDMEAGTGAETGIVAARLGADRLPVYGGPPGGTMTVSGQASFDQWFRDVPGTNHAIAGQLQLVRLPDGTWTVSSSSFFPIDNQGFGNEGRPRNYHFTMEMHTHFVYRGGEVFTFRGDDDVFVFINDHLVIDLGGVHTPLQASVNLDAVAPQIGLEVGKAYALDFFFAERHTSESNFSITTSIRCIIPQ